METAALVLGIVSLAISFGLGFADLGWIGSICAIVGIILGAIGMKNNGPLRSRAKIGMILSIIALSWGIVATIACFACVACGASVLGGLVKA